MALTDKPALCLLSDVKDDLGISSGDTSSDAGLERRILAASAMIEAYLSRKLQRVAVKVEKVRGYGGTLLVPSLTPIVSVASIVTLDGELVDADSYELRYVDGGTEAFAIYSPTGWLDSSPLAGTVAGDVVGKTGQEQAYFTVTYDGGYSLPNDSTKRAPELPAPISEACIMVAVQAWRNKGRDFSVAAESASESSITYAAGGGLFLGAGGEWTGGLPMAVAEMLKPYRRLG